MTIFEVRTIEQGGTRIITSKLYSSQDYAKNKFTKLKELHPDRDILFIQRRVDESTVKYK